MKDLAPSHLSGGVNPRSIDHVITPAHYIPEWVIGQARERGAETNFLVNTWGGLGDQICSEPALRFGLKNFKSKKISLATEMPSLFSHLEFEKVYDLRKERPRENDYLVLQSIHTQDHLIWQFMGHMTTHPVDFVSLCLWRFQMPTADREIQLPHFFSTSNTNLAFGSGAEEHERTVVIHAGKHWKSKTFPKDWWASIVNAFQGVGFRVVLIGQKVDDNVGYVEGIENPCCIDLRDKLSIQEFVTVLKQAKYLFSNDSSPIHAAAAGDAFIGFVATCKHPDFLTHYRKGQFGYKTKNFGLDGIWNHIDYSPAQTKQIEAESLPDGLMEKILPQPLDVAYYYADLAGLK